jgi:hypothetical protein
MALNENPQPLPLRCPACQALVVDRRSPTCTTCRHALPEEWIMTPIQAKKMMALDRDTRAEHTASLNRLDPRNDPVTPPGIRFLETPWGM